MTNTAVPKAPAKSNTARILGLSVLVLVVLGGLGAWGAYWFLIGQHHVTTDDAYVNGDIVEITSEVPGTVIALHADNTQSVVAGDPLVGLDPADAEIAVSAAEADLALAVRQVRSLTAQADQLKAQIANNQITLDRAEADYKRRRALVSDGGVSTEELSHAKDTIAQLSAAVDAATAAYTATESQIAGTTIATHPTVRAAAARLRNAELALHRALISAPVAGIVAKRSVEIGQHVDPGTALMSIIPLEDLWIDANFKEVQLEHLRLGQPVRVQADLYGSAITYHGRVAGVAAGSGGTFALLPAQNASGNWIKIVQRLPVRILLDPSEVKAHPLRLGLSATVDVDITKTENLPATPTRNFALPSTPSAGDDPAVAALIARIIAENAGPPAEVAKGLAP
jgi:membrane fusion protein (multidrug efflux system)